jgi:hypothetical protein
MMRLPLSASLRSFTLSAIGLSLGLGLVAFEGTAEAGRSRFGRFGGGVRISGRAHSGVSVRFARPWRSFWRPRVWVGGSVWVGGYYYPRPYYYYYYPEYVPSYYYGQGYGQGYYGGSYYPVQPNAAPGVVAAAPQRRPMPTFGIGVAAGGSNVDGRQDSSDLAALVRFRLTPGLLIEGELGRTEFENNVRVDRRIGGSLVWEIGAHNSFAPYILGGGGVQQAEVDGSFSTTQEFGEIGVGLRWALSRHLHLTADIRAGARKAIDSDQPERLSAAVRAVAPPIADDDTEKFTRARLAAILYF